MRNDPKTLLRGLVKLVAVVVAAGLAGALIGIGLAKLSGDDDSDAAALPVTAPTTATNSSGTASTTPAFPVETTTTAAPTTQTQTTSTQARRFLVPRIKVRSAQLISADGKDGVTVKVRVTNRSIRPLKMTGPVLISVQDEIPLDDASATAARPLLRTLAPGKSATGTLRFSTPPEMTQRLTDNLGARLRIATRTITMKLTAATP